MPHRKRIRLAPPKGNTGKANGTLFASESLLFVSATQPPYGTDQAGVLKSIRPRRTGRE